MDTTIFAGLPMPANLALFGVAASLVWIAGIKLTAYAKTIAERTGSEQAFIGILLLGTVVFLPELATSVSAAALGDARLAVNTLLGGIAATMAILAITDAVTGSEALSTDVSHPVVLLQGPPYFTDSSTNCLRSVDAFLEIVTGTITDPLALEAPGGQVTVPAGSETFGGVTDVLCLRLQR